MDALERGSESAPTGSTRGRHAMLLASLVALLFALPVLEWAPDRGLRFPLLLLLVLIAAAAVNGPRRRHVWTAGLLGGAAIAGIAVGEGTGHVSARAAGEALGILLLTNTTGSLIRALARARQVDLDIVVGGACVYLLIGLCYAMVYRLVVDLLPGSFVMADVALAEVPGDSSALPTRLVYFSFVTLTTVGYGDVLPRAGLAQTLAVSEAVLGQLYLAMFVARLMGLYMAGTSRGPEYDAPPEQVPNSLRTPEQPPNRANRPE